ncbi:MAG: ABC transporter permease subunit [Verrucomicrobiales bacterium]|jgi:polar amino acid transport system substrate-binding protein|nr:ABC transporter permease subunit [Verrucomicrobiales bacterium]
MKRLISLFILFLFLTIPSQAEPDPLVVGMELEYPPFEFVADDGTNDGVSVKMAEALARHLDRPLEIQNIKFDALITALKSGSIDLIISSMTATEERRKSINFSDPYVTTGLAMLVPKDSPIKGIKDLISGSRKVVVKLGTTGESFARSKLKNATILTMTQDPACALEVAQKKVDVWIYDQLSIFHHHKQHKETTRALLKPIREEQWAIGIRKPKFGEDDSLRIQVNKFLRNFRESGQFEELSNTYLQEEKELVKSMGIPFIFDVNPDQKIDEVRRDEDSYTEVDPLFIVIMSILVLLTIIAFWYLTREGDVSMQIHDNILRNSLGFVVLWIVLIGICFFIFSSINRSYHWNWEGIWNRRWQIFGGWIRTLWISFSALVLCIGVGTGLVIGSRCSFRPLRFFCRAYTEIVRGSPLLVVLLFGYYVIAEAFNINGRIMVGILLLALFAGAYLGEILRGGIDSVGKTQFDSARAVGFSRVQTYRYVIIPQAVRRVLPAVAGLFIMLVKDSSLLSVIGAEEFTKRSDIARAATFTGIEGYLPLAVGYLLITIPLAYCSKRLERKFSYES